MQFIKKCLENNAIEGAVLYDSLDDIAELSISIDSRKTKNGEAFLALKGDRVDGHDYLEEALENGAQGLIIQENKKKCLDKIPKRFLGNITVVAVPDTLHALISLAREFRKKIDIPVVALTGSVGKTTTKEMLRSILDNGHISAFVSHGNQNSIIGLSLNILKVRPHHKFAVFELGINDKGEMAELVSLASPALGAITWITEAHTLGLGTIEEIAKEKLLIFSPFNSQNTGIIPGDLKILHNMDFSHSIIRFGNSKKNQIQASNVKRRDGGYFFTLKVYEKRIDVFLKCELPEFVNNALAATALAYVLGVPIEEIAKGLETFSPVNGRFKRKKMIGDFGYMIDDSYNASPESMKAALLAFDGLEHQTGPKVAILGDMLELGDSTVFWHRYIGEVLKNTKSIQNVILVGEHVKYIEEASGMPVTFAKNWQEAQQMLMEMLEENSFLLLKASLGIGLRNLVLTLT